MMNHPNGPNQMRLDPAHVEPKPSRHRLALGLTLLGLLSLAGTGVGMGLYHVSNTLIWDRFDTVKPGVLYRSGQLSEGQLREAIKRYGIRTVVNFQVGGAGIGDCQRAGHIVPEPAHARRWIWPGRAVSRGLEGC